MYLDTVVQTKMYLDIVYIYMHSKWNISRKTETSYNLGRM
jgi:hypothetical protein